MANPDYLKMLRQGADTWNAWRRETFNTPDLELGFYPDLSGAEFIGLDLRGPVDLRKANLIGANLRAAILSEADLGLADLRGADLSGTNLMRARLFGANLSEANLGGAFLLEANLGTAHLRKAFLRKAFLLGADLHRAHLDGADLSVANLHGANLRRARLRRADLRGADLRGASLLEADITNADLTGSRIYGVSAWNVKLSSGTKQQDLIITAHHEPEVTVDNIEVAQFVYLLLHNAKIRDVIDTVGKKAVLLLGRFTGGRIAVLERLRAELRERGYLPIVFNFDKPETKDFTETVRLLAALSHFVIADITNPKSAPLELQATVPEIMVPFLPIIEEGEKPFAMLEDLWKKHREWVFEPLHYSSIGALVGALDKEIIGPAEAKFDELIVRKAEKMKGKHV